ncbi:uncharacterized protein [Pagrus major]|uniref:uncharacterized protein n=1 Tax=Pagrus major TaxID=143350 RepID=UPI003CC87857
MKIPLPVTPPTSNLWPSSNHAAALSQELDMDGGYDDIGILNHPSLPSEEHPSKTTEADLSDDNMYEELDDRWREQAEKLKKCQESISGNEDTNQVTEKKQAELKGTINSKEMKAKDIKAKEEEKKQLKQQKAKKKKTQKEKTKFKINKKGKRNKDFKGETSDLNQDENVEVTHITDDYANTESVCTGHGGLKEVEKEYGWSDDEFEVYDDIGEPADVCSGLNLQNFNEEGVYDNLGNPDSSVSPLPQPSTDEGDIYDDVDSQKPPLPSDRYDDFKEDCIYGNTTEEH